MTEDYVRHRSSKCGRMMMFSRCPLMPSGDVFTFYLDATWPPTCALPRKGRFKVQELVTVWSSYPANARRTRHLHFVNDAV